MEKNCSKSRLLKLEDQDDREEELVNGCASHRGGEGKGEGEREEEEEEEEEEEGKEVEAHENTS